jgi:hypothetical protein
MSSYASYCHQAGDCARRARLARSPEIVAYCRSLELRWRRLAEQAQETGSALGHESNPVAMLLPLRDKAATSPVKYRKRTRERVAEPHSLFDIVSCKARARAEQMDDPEAKRTMLNDADGYERLAERAEAGRWPQSK